MRVRTKYFHLAFRTLYLQMLQRKVLENSLSWGREKKILFIPLYSSSVGLKSTDHRRLIFIKCQEGRRDAICWCNFSQAVRRNVFSLQGAQILEDLELRSWRTWSLSEPGSSPGLTAGPLLWWPEVFHFIYQANDEVAFRQQEDPHTHTHVKNQQPIVHYPPPPMFFLER